ncbi:MAG: MTH938/NDUFAF3 family protein, partial [Planctomycetota bacterium]
GHLLSAEDLEIVIAARPSVLVVGCGASGLMKVPGQTRKVLQQNDIQLEALDTHKAVQRFNELSDQGANVAAALHLTC